MTEREKLVEDMLDAADPRWRHPIVSQSAIDRMSAALTVAEAAFARLEAEVRADALEEAARDYPAASENMDLVNYPHEESATWLQERAAAIRARKAGNAVRAQVGRCSQRGRRQRRDVPALRRCPRRKPRCPNARLNCSDDGTIAGWQPQQQGDGDAA